MGSVLPVSLLLLTARLLAPAPLKNPALQHLPLTVLPDTLAYCLLPAGAPVPAWAAEGKGPRVVVEFLDERSVLTSAASAPASADCVRDFRPIRLDPLSDDITGVIATLSGVLARANVSIYVVSTRTTDYFLVHSPDLTRAVDALRKAGHRVKAE